MKKIIFIYLLFLTANIIAYADNLPQIPYKNINDKTDIYYDTDSDQWLTKFNKKDKDFFTKHKLNNDETYYLTNAGEYVFKTECDFEFIKNGKFICYSNDNLKFYNLAYIDGHLIRNSLSTDDVKVLFPDYKIIPISEFSQNTNSFKIKKKKIAEKIILLNDTNRQFSDYEFSSGNAKFEKYDLKGFLTIHKKGMIQFSKLWENSQEYPWYILLIR